VGRLPRQQAKDPEIYFHLRAFELVKNAVFTLMLVGPEDPFGQAGRVCNIQIPADVASKFDHSGGFDASHAQGTIRVPITPGERPSLCQSHLT
jgi:hypothetical protein